MSSTVRRHVFGVAIQSACPDHGRKRKQPGAQVGLSRARRPWFAQFADRLQGHSLHHQHQLRLRRGCSQRPAGLAVFRSARRKGRREPCSTRCPRVPSSSVALRGSFGKASKRRLSPRAGYRKHHAHPALSGTVVEARVPPFWAFLEQGERLTPGACAVAVDSRFWPAMRSLRPCLDPGTPESADDAVEAGFRRSAAASRDNIFRLISAL